MYGTEAVNIGCGGTIPFMGMLGERSRSTQFFVTGVLGPHSNAHGPNEFLHLEYAEEAHRLRLAGPGGPRAHAQRLAHVDHVARCQGVLEALPALAVRAALSAGVSNSATANSAFSASSITVHLGRPLGTCHGG